jgi:hypothetical protein
MISISILSQSARYAAAIAACIAMINWLSPAEAAKQQSSVSVFSDVPVSGVTSDDDSNAAIGVPARNRALALTSHLPWRAPIGHRHPQRADVPITESISAWERQQRRFDQELDRKLIICRGC